MNMETIFDPLCSPTSEFVKSSSFLDDLESDYVFAQYPSNDVDYTHSDNFEKFLDTNFNECKYDNKRDINLFDDFDFLNPTDIHLEANNSIFRLSTSYDIPWTKSIFDKDLIQNNFQKTDASESEEISDIYVNFSDSVLSTNQIFDFSIKNTKEETDHLDEKIIENKSIVLNEDILKDNDKKKNSTLSYSPNLTNISPFFDPSSMCSTSHFSSLIENKLKEPLISGSKLSTENSLKQVNTQSDDMSKQLHDNEYQELSQVDSFDYNASMLSINDTFLQNYYTSDELFFKKRSFPDFSDNDIYLSRMSLKKNKSIFPMKNNIYDHTFDSMVQNNSKMLTQSYVSPKSIFIFDNNDLSSPNYERTINERQNYVNTSSSMPFEVYLPNTTASWSSLKHNYPVSITSIRNKPSKNINLKDISSLSPSKLKKTRKYPISSRSFINFTERDAEIILNGVAPSGSSKKH
ncbi:hypothetical protein PMAC_001504 [Pneumocystis sp. 'macacae']|nr:hypothetical protein PMAC_001504 [Pneumocystis sp. 'macacae']